MICNVLVTRVSCLFSFDEFSHLSIKKKKKNLPGEVLPAPACFIPAAAPPRRGRRPSAGAQRWGEPPLPRCAEPPWGRTKRKRPRRGSVPSGPSLARRGTGNLRGCRGSRAGSGRDRGAMVTHGDGGSGAERHRPSCGRVAGEGGPGQVERDREGMSRAGRYRPRG